MVGLSLDVQYPFIKLKYKNKEAKIGGSYNIKTASGKKNTQLQSYLSIGLPMILAICLL